MTERLIPGVVEEYPKLYQTLQPFGVAASIRDDGLAEVFGTSLLTNMPMPFQELTFHLGTGLKSASDYPRVEGMSDHAYVVAVLNQALAEYRKAYGEDIPLDGAESMEYDHEAEEAEPIIN